MEYGAKYSTPSETADTYLRYLESLAVFVGWLLEHQYDVKLLLGDADTVVIDDFRAVLREHLGPYEEERVTWSYRRFDRRRALAAQRDRSRRRDAFPQRLDESAARQASPRDLVPSQGLVTDERDGFVRVLSRHQ